MKYRGYIAQFLQNYFSDHSPIQIETMVGDAHHRKYFRFINDLGDKDKFLLIVKSVWSMYISGNCMHRVWKKLQLCKAPQQKLSREKLRSIERKIDQARDNLV